MVHKNMLASRAWYLDFPVTLICVVSSNYKAMETVYFLKEEQTGIIINSKKKAKEFMHQRESFRQRN